MEQYADVPANSNNQVPGSEPRGFIPATILESDTIDNEAVALGSSMASTPKLPTQNGHLPLQRTANVLGTGLLPATQEVAEDGEEDDTVDAASLAEASAHAAGGGVQDHSGRIRGRRGARTVPPSGSRDFRTTETLDRFAHFTIKKQTSYR